MLIINYLLFRFISIIDQLSTIDYQTKLIPTFWLTENSGLPSTTARPFCVIFITSLVSRNGPEKVMDKQDIIQRFPENQPESHLWHQLKKL